MLGGLNTKGQETTKWQRKYLTDTQYHRFRESGGDMSKTCKDCKYRKGNCRGENPFWITISERRKSCSKYKTADALPKKGE